MHRDDASSGNSLMCRGAALWRRAGCVLARDSGALTRSGAMERAQLVLAHAASVSNGVSGIRYESQHVEEITAQRSSRLGRRLLMVVSITDNTGDGFARVSD